MLEVGSWSSTKKTQVHDPLCIICYREIQSESKIWYSMGQKQLSAKLQH